MLRLLNLLHKSVSIIGHSDISVLKLRIYHSVIEQIIRRNIQFHPNIGWNMVSYFTISKDINMMSRDIGKTYTWNLVHNWTSLLLIRYSTLWHEGDVDNLISVDNWNGICLLFWVSTYFMSVCPFSCLQTEASYLLRRFIVMWEVVLNLLAMLLVLLIALFWVNIIFINIPFTEEQRSFSWAFAHNCIIENVRDFTLF